MTPDASEVWNGVWTVSGYPQAASEVLAKTFTEAHRFMPYSYMYLSTTDLTFLSFWFKSSTLGKKQKTCFKTQTQQFAPSKETPTTTFAVNSFSLSREALSSLL